MSGLREPCVVIGSKGMLGTDLVNLLLERGVETVALDIDEIDICDSESVQRAFRQYAPGTAINVAAMTDVDGCESCVEEAFRVNAEGPRNVALAAAESGASMIHMSTDYVFDGLGTRPYREDDPMVPVGVYGASKARGELHVRTIIPRNHCIVRTQWLFGVHGKNFVEAILNAAQSREVLRVVDDQRGRPTYTADLARAIIVLGRLSATGTFHVASSGETSWFEFARAIVDRAGLNRIRVEPIKSTELARPAPRPAYSVLDTSSFTALAGYSLRHWTDALDEYFRIRSGESDKSPPTPL